MKLFNIYYEDSYGRIDLIATTNNFDKWLEDNNKDREEPESLDDFQIEEADLYFYKEKEDE
jgi:hypothetical protein